MTEKEKFKLAEEYLSRWISENDYDDESVKKMGYEKAFDEFTEWMYLEHGWDSIVRYVGLSLSPEFIKDFIEEVFPDSYSDAEIEKMLAEG